jgi:hypothetical protein
MIPQISTWARGPRVATNRLDVTLARIPMGYIFIEIVTESETYHIYEAVLLII